MMNLYPFDMRVVAVPDDEAGVSAGGIHFLTDESIPYKTGNVIAVGAHDSIKVGDKIMWKRSNGMPILENRKIVAWVLDRESVIAKVLPEGEG